MSDGAHHHGTSLTASLVGGAAAIIVPVDGPLSRFLVGVTTTVVGWLATRFLAWAERRWKERR